MRRILLAASCLAATIVPSIAGDLAPPEAKAFSWQGPYVGATLGIVLNDAEISPKVGGEFLVYDPVNYIASYNTPWANQQTTATAGLSAGYNWQFDHVVAGVEADINWRGAENSGFEATPSRVLTGNFIYKSFSTSGDWFGTVRGRLGYAADRLLVYGTGGLAFGESEANVHYGAGAYEFSGSASSTRLGYAVGAGAEYAVAPNWTLKAEYLYVDLGTVDSVLTNNPNNPLLIFTMSSSYSDSFQLLRAGINYRF